MSEHNLTASELLDCARAFESHRPFRKNVPLSAPGAQPIPPRPMEILTPEELMARLKVTKSWISEKRRPRCIHPLPALTNRPLRFNWYAIMTWLEEEAQQDAERLQHKRVRPATHRRSLKVVRKTA